MNAQVSDTRIQIHFDIHEPVELVEMTLALQSLAQEYQSYLSGLARKENKKADPRGVKLYVTKIESNCILTELAGAMEFFGLLAIPLMDQALIFTDFVNLVKQRLLFFKGLVSREKVSAEDIPYSRREADRIGELAALVAKNKDGRLGLNVIRYKEKSDEYERVLEVSFTSDEAFDIHKGTMIAKQALEIKEGADLEKVLMYFHQTNTDDPKIQGPTGDRAVITRVQSKPLKVYVIQETDQQKIRFVLDDLEHNPLRIGFMVDVNVEKDVKGVPRAYRIVRIHDVIYPESEEDDDTKES